MPVDLYYVPGSAPCRAVRLTAKAVGVDLNLKHLDLMKGEHMTPEFLKINLQHTVPTLDDNGFVLWESRAILGYLADKYGKDDSLYPKDPQKRSLVNQRLFFDQGTLYQRIGEYIYPPMFGGQEFDPEKLKKLEEAFAFLEKFLEKSPYVAGSNLTIADHTVAASVSTADVTGFPVSNYPSVAKWYAKIKTEMPGYDDANGQGSENFRQLFNNLTAGKKK